MTDSTTLAAATSVATFVFAAGSPGPATLAVAATAMAGGRPRGAAMALGLSLGLGVWGVVIALGFGALVAQSAPILTILKLIGAGYLFYLAYASGRSALQPLSGPVPVAPQADTARLFRRGLMLNLGNPKAVLAWVAALALGAEAAPGGAVSVAVLAICAGLGAAIYLAYATLFSLAPVMALYSRMRRWIEALFAGLFALAGLRLLFWRNA